MRALILATGLIHGSALKVATPVFEGPATGGAAKPVDMLNEDNSRGERGHFYYSNTCSDCVYKGSGCGCEPAVEYLACVTKHCSKANTTMFAEKCVAMGDKCNSELDIDCRGPETVCKSKYHQLAGNPAGGIGLTVDISNNNAYCGPHGVCIGKLTMTAEIYRRAEPKLEVAPKVGAASPGPAPSHAPVAAAPAAAAVSAPPAPPVWLECGLPKGPKADINVKEDWSTCQVAVKGDSAHCDLPMFKELEAGDSKKGYCVLTDGKDGKRLTQAAMSKIINVHEKKTAAAKPVEPAKVKPAEKPKPPQPKPAEKPKSARSIVTEASISQDSEKLPWMVEKEKRAEAKKEVDAKKAAQPKVEMKEEAKPEVKKDLGNQDGKLPWMKGKGNEKAAPPTVEEAIVGPK